MDYSLNKLFVESDSCKTMVLDSADLHSPGNPEIALSRNHVSFSLESNHELAKHTCNLSTQLSFASLQLQAIFLFRYPLPYAMAQAPFSINTPPSGT